VAEELAREVDRPREDVLTLEAEYGSIQLLYNGGAEIGDHIMSFADLPGATPQEMLVLANVATWLWVGGTADDAAVMAERSLGGGRAVQVAGADSIAVMQAAWVLSYAERHELAEATLAVMHAEARATGSVFALTSTSALNALVAYRRGNVLRAEAEARNGMVVPGLPPLPTRYCTRCCASLCSSRGSSTRPTR